MLASYTGFVGLNILKAVYREKRRILHDLKVVILQQNPKSFSFSSHYIEKKKEKQKQNQKQNEILFLSSLLLLSSLFCVYAYFTTSLCLMCMVYWLVVDAVMM